MKILGYEIRKASKEEISNVVAGDGTWFPKVGIDWSKEPMKLSTVYRCVNLISESLAVLPIKIYSIDKDGFKREAVDHPMYWMLNQQPNEYMNRFTWARLMVTSTLLKGNGYAYIERNPQGKPVQLIFLSEDDVLLTWYTDADGIKRKRYWIQRFKELVEPSDMIHILNFSSDGQIGVSTLTHARQTLGIASSNEESVVDHFRGGQNMTGVLTIEGARLSKEQKQEIYDRWADRTGHAGGMQILEGNMHYQPISISPKDSQLLESREFNVIEICRFFGVSPVKAFDLSKSSYSTVEATQLQYLVDTVMSWITRFEQELNNKLIMPSERGKYVIEFDTSVLLRTDKAAMATYWREMFNVGAATPNEIRQHNNLPRVEGGDYAFVQVNVQRLKDAGVSDTQQVDN